MCFPKQIVIITKLWVEKILISLMGRKVITFIGKEEICVVRDISPVEDGDEI